MNICHINKGDIILKYCLLVNLPEIKFLEIINAMYITMAKRYDIYT